MSDLASSTTRLLQVCISANLGGLVAGTHLALFSGLLEMPLFASAVFGGREHGALSAFDKSIITTALVVAFMLASPPAGPWIDRAGRRPALLVSAALFAASSVGLLFARSIVQVVATRLLAGVGYAIANIVCPMYTAEIAPPHRRGMLVNLYQLSITIGILFAQLCNLLFADNSWKGPVACSLGPALFMLLSVWVFVPESPTWLSAQLSAIESNNETNAAHQSPASTDIETAPETPPEPFSMAVPTLRSLLADQSARRRLVIGAGLCAAQQWSGINAVIFFGPALVSDVLGWEGSYSSMQAAVVIGVANVAATVVSIALVDRFGRRTLLLAGAPPMAVCLITLGGMRADLLPIPDVVGVLALVVYVASFAMSYGPLPFVICSEIFPVRYKGVGMSVCGVVLGACSIVVGLSFLPMLETIGGVVYSIYAICMIVASLFVWRAVPETRKLSLEEIDALMEGKPS